MRFASDSFFASGLSKRAGFYYLSQIADFWATAVALLLLLLPGMLFVRADEWKRAEPIELVGVAFGCSVAFWTVSFWILRFVPVSWRVFAAGVMVLSALLAALVRRGSGRAAWAAWRREPGAALLQFGFLCLVIVLRLAFAATHVAYSGGDMTEHATMAEEIVIADGFPTTQEPLLPIPRFGEFPPGFHCISALVTLLSCLPTYRSTIVVFCLAAAAMTFALYALLRALRLPRGACAVGAAGAIFLTRNPQLFLQWGGAPSILAAAVGIVLFRECLRFGREQGLAAALRAGLLAAGVFLTHPLAAVGVAWILPPILLLACLSAGVSWKLVTRDAGTAVLLALLFASPFLAVAPHSAPPEAAAWAPSWFQAEIRGAVALQNRFLPTLDKGGGPATWPFFLVAYLGILGALLLAAGLIRGALGPRREAFAIGVTVLAVQAFLFAGALYQFLPGWPALYPTRTGLWLMIPLGIAIAEIAAAIVRHRPLSLAIASAFSLAFCLEGFRLSASRFGASFYGDARAGRGTFLSVLANETAGGAFWVTTFCRDNAAVTTEDLAALAWVRGHTPPDAVFANNPGDGGSLLPAAAHRKIVEPHYYWFFDKAYVESWRERARIGFIYVGAEPAPAWGRRWTSEELDRDHRVQRVHVSGRARVYRVREPFAASIR